MTTFLILRHGFSTSNEDGTLTGQIDAPLTPLGFLQGEAACRYIAENYKVDAVYASDLTRAVDTVRPLSRATGLPITEDAELREMGCGEWSGEKVSLLAEKYGSFYTAWSNVSDAHTPKGGEVWSAVGRRMYDALSRIARENDGRTVVVASHGGAIMALRGTYFGLPLSDWKERLPFAPNAALIVSEYADGVFREHVVIDSYLGELKTEMPKGI